MNDNEKIGIRLPDDEERLIRREPYLAEHLRDPDRLNDYVMAIFNGEAIASPSDIHTYLIALLRCDGEILPEVRTAVAYALERGRGGMRDFPIGSEGNPMPLLRVECADGVGRAAASLQAAERKMEAAEALVDYREETGIRGEQARDAIKAKFEISDADLKKGTAMLNAFFRDLDTHEGREACALIDSLQGELGEEAFDPTLLSHYQLARHRFLSEWSFRQREVRRAKQTGGPVLEP